MAKEWISKAMITKVGKHRPNSTQTKVIIPNELVRELGIDVDNRDIKIVLEGKRIIIEKVGDIWLKYLTTMQERNL